MLSRRHKTITNFALGFLLASIAVVAQGFALHENSASFYTSCGLHCISFVTTKATEKTAALKHYQWNIAQRAVVRSWSKRTRLAANGGMDAYEAQMAAMMARKYANSQKPQASTTEYASYEPAISSASATKWSGQNSYTQLLQQPLSDFSNSYSKYAGETIRSGAGTSLIDAGSRNLFFDGQQKQRDISDLSTITDVESIPNEMQLDNLLRSLQKDIRDATVATGAETSDLGISYSKVNEKQDIMVDKLLQILVQNKKLPLMENNNEGTDTFTSSQSTSSQPIQAMNQQKTVLQPSSIIESPSNADIKKDGKPEENMEDKFLKMLSNEIQYKKFLNQNPYSITDIEASTLINRLLDNLEDSTQKNNGKIKGQSRLQGKDMPKEGRKTIVVLGTGWASHAFVKLASTYDLRIVVVSPVNHFVFTPMLASAAVGTVEYRSMTEPIRVTNPYIDNFVEGRAIGVDVKSKKVQVQLTSLSTVTGAFKGIAATAPCRLEPEPVLTQIVYGEDGAVLRDKTQGAGGVIELNYDYLICAVGTASRSSIVPGAKEHCFNLKTSQDSKRLRTAIGEALEMASRPDVQEFYYPDAASKIMAREERRRRVRIVIVGGGPTGVELSGELCDFFAQMCRKPDGAYQHLREDVSVMLVHGGNELLPAMDQELRTRALDALKAQGVDVRLNSRLKEVGQDYIVIAEKGSDIVETIPIGISVWAAGNAPVPFVKELLSQLPPSAAGSGGRINVDRWLRCPTPTEETFGSILVLGDVACFESQPKYESSPQPLPQTAQVAGQQGAFVARLLNRGYNMQLTPPKLPEVAESEAFSLLRVWLISRGLEEAPGFNFLNLGLLAYVGQEEALNQVMLGDVPLFNYYGKIAFALWRTVYLAKQASSRNQALIAFDWLRTETFGRDITRL